MVAPSVSTTMVDVSHIIPGPCRFLYKNELEQPSGSFKLRGMSKLVDSAVKQAKAEGKEGIHIYTSSGGNAGLAAAYASRFHHVQCTVVLPVLTKQAALDKLKEYGASITIHGAHWGEADAHLREVIIPAAPESVSAIYCHPFDNEVLWDGHGDIVDEFEDQLAELKIDASKVKGVVCSTGGGGLYNGIVAGLQRTKSLKDVPVLVLETLQTPAFHESVKEGKVVTLPKVETLSTSLGAPYIAEKSLANYHLHPTKLGIMDDLEAVKATVQYFDIFGKYVEPACGATLAVSLDRKDLLAPLGPLEKDDVVVFIVCGGSTVNATTLQQYREMIK